MSISFDRAASFYDRTRSIPDEAHARGIELMCRAGNLSATSRALEIGVGTGRIALPLAEHVGAVFGADISRAMMGQLLARRGGKPVYVAQADATRLPFPAGAFDAVIAVHVFHLISDWRAALAEVRRALRPGGLLVMAATSVPFVELYHAMREAVVVQSVGIPFEERWTFLLSEGWWQEGDSLTHTFRISGRPQEFIDDMAARSSSPTWQLTDAQLAAAVAAVRARAETLWGDPTQEVEREGVFEVRVYRPPEG